MRTAIVIFLLAVVLMGGGLLAFYRNARQELPKNLPPPLKDDPEDDWPQGKGPGSRDKS